VVGIVGGLNAEKAIPPPRIVRESDIFDDEIELPLRGPLLPPRMTRFLERLAKFYVLNLIRRWKQTDHEIRQLLALPSLADMKCSQSHPRQKPQGREVAMVLRTVTATLRRSSEARQRTE
jgi:hypothetical protein